MEEIFNVQNVNVRFSFVSGVALHSALQKVHSKETLLEVKKAGQPELVVDLGQLNFGQTRDFVIKVASAAGKIAF